jgi:antitoxin PrlF
MSKLYATLTSKGQLTIPVTIREAWNLKPGDRIAFEVIGPKEARVEPARRRSILEDLDDLIVRGHGPITQEEIDQAIDEAMDEKMARSKSTRGS